MKNYKEFEQIYIGGSDIASLVLDFIPVDMVGLSVYIYHITQEDVNKFKSKE